MNQPEFKLWLDFHCGMFAGIRDWLRRKGLTANQIIEAWQRSLVDVGLEEAKSASCRLWESESCPKTYDRHPVEIKRLCKRTSGLAARQVGQRSDGTVKCLRCEDEGLISVFYFINKDFNSDGRLIRKREMFDASIIIEHVLAVRHERDLRISCVACDCGQGENFQAHPRWQAFCLKADGGSAWRRAEHWWENAADQKPIMAGANSVTSFDQLDNARMESF